MSNIFTQSLLSNSKVGNPTVRQGTLYVSCPSILNQAIVSTPAVGHINLGGYSIASDQQRFGVPSLYTTSAVREVHPQVEFQVPSFIQDEHREFLHFMREYYRFTEKAEGPLHFLRRLLSIQDVDTTTTELIEYFFREYAPSFPRDTALSPDVLIKNIKNFYLAKGSEKSFKFLFRVFFGQDVEFYYPRVDILRFSDAKWVQDKTIKCVRIKGDPTKLIGNRIIGTKSKASAFVEKILFIQDGSISTYELFLNRSSIVGKFQANETIKDESETCTLRAIPLVSKVKILKKGKGYQVGQEVSIVGEGFNCKARISSVGTFGEIEAVQIYQFGAGYRPDSTTVNFADYEGVTEGASAVVEFDTTATYPGYFLNSDGMFSSGKRIQDGYYYQQYSYVVKSEESRDKYESIVKKLVHPAGFIFFSEVSTESVIDASSDIPQALDQSVATEVEIYNELDSLLEHAGSDLVLSGCTIPEEETIVEISEENVTFDMSSLSLGPTWSDWETWKTDYRPTSAFGDRNAGMVQEGYYNMYANTPLKAFANVPLSQIAFQGKSPMDFVPETDITQEVG